MISETKEKCIECRNFTYLPIKGMKGWYCGSCYDEKKHTQFIYPKNPKYNGNYCAGPEGVNIYDHLNDKGEIDWNAVNKAKEEFYRKNRQHQILAYEIPNNGGFFDWF